MPYRNDTDPSECDSTIGFLGKLRMKISLLSLLVGCAIMIGSGLINYIAISVIMVVAALGFIITLIIGGDAADKARIFVIYPILSLFGAAIVSGAIMLITGFHHIPTNTEIKLNICEIKLHGAERTAIQLSGEWEKNNGEN